MGSALDPIPKAPLKTRTGRGVESASPRTLRLIANNYYYRTLAGDDGRPGRFHAHREAADSRPDTGQNAQLCPSGSLQDAALAIPWG
jgi:hypothetical protein